MAVIEGLKPFVHLTKVSLEKLSSDDQAAVWGVLEGLLAQGKDPAQAVATAVARAAPEAARGSPAPVGGLYDYIENPDGSFDVLDVPLMGEIPEGAHGNAVPVDKAFMVAAIKKARARLREEGYLPPLHLRHHPDEGTTRLGHFLPRYVEMQTYQGKEIPVTMGDLKQVKAEYLAPMQAGEFPYRSIEINNLNAEPEIDSLAILDHEVPFFRFPILTLGRKIAASALPPGSVLTLDGNPARGAYHGADGQAAFLYCMEASGMTLEDRMDKLEKAVAALAKGKAKAADEDDPDAKAKAMEDEDEDKKAKAKAEEDKPADDASPVEEPDEKGESDDKETAKKKAKAAAQASAADVENATLKGRLTAVESKLQKKDDEEALNALVASATGTLKGYPQPTDHGTTLRLMASKGEDVLDAYVESYKGATTKEPPRTLADLEAGDGGDPDLPEAVLKLRAAGPDKFEAGIKAHRMYQELDGAGGFKLSFEEYLAANVQ